MKSWPWGGHAIRLREDQQSGLFYGEAAAMWLGAGISSRGGNGGRFGIQKDAGGQVAAQIVKE